MRLGLDFFFFLCYNTHMKNKLLLTKRDWIELSLATILCVGLSILSICTGLSRMGILTF